MAIQDGSVQWEVKRTTAGLLTYGTGIIYLGGLTIADFREIVMQAIDNINQFPSRGKVVMTFGSSLDVVVNNWTNTAYKLSNGGIFTVEISNTANTRTGRGIIYGYGSPVYCFSITQSVWTILEKYATYSDAQALAASEAGKINKVDKAVYIMVNNSANDIRGKTVGDLKTIITKTLPTLKDKGKTVMTLLFKLDELVNNWNNTSYTFSDSVAVVSIEIGNVGGVNSNYAHFKIYSYANDEYYFYLNNGVWSDLIKNSTVIDSISIASSEASKILSGYSKFTGTVKVPTITDASDNTDNAASTKFVQAAIAAALAAKGL